VVILHFFGFWPIGKCTKIFMHGQCDARPTVISRISVLIWALADTKLGCWWLWPIPN